MRLSGKPRRFTEVVAGSHLEAYGVQCYAQCKIGFEVASVKGNLLVICRVNLLPWYATKKNAQKTLGVILSFLDSQICNRMSQSTASWEES